MALFARKALTVLMAGSALIPLQASADLVPEASKSAEQTASAESCHPLRTHIKNLYEIGGQEPLLFGLAEDGEQIVLFAARPGEKQSSGEPTSGWTLIGSNFEKKKNPSSKERVFCIAAEGKQIGFLPNPQKISAGTKVSYLHANSPDMSDAFLGMVNPEYEPDADIDPGMLKNRNCYRHEDYAGHIARRYGQTRIAMGDISLPHAPGESRFFEIFAVSSGGVPAFSNMDEKGYTIAMTNEKGITCPISRGTQFAIQPAGQQALTIKAP